MGPNSSALNLFWLIVPIFVGLGLLGLNKAMHIESSISMRIEIAVYGVGFILFLIAKMSMIRKGIFHSFGAKKMNRINKVLYYAGYALMVSGVIMVLMSKV